MLEPTVMIAVTCLVGLCVTTFAVLKAWSGWLSLKQRELDISPQEIEGGVGASAARIEIADLKERIKKLEAIASGVDL